MANLDTALKRGSCVQVGGSSRRTLPFPDGTVGTQDRPFVSYTYAGIAFAAPGGAVQDFLPLMGVG